MVRRCIEINPNDTVAMVLENAQRGDVIETSKEKLLFWKM